MDETELLRLKGAVEVARTAAVAASQAFDHDNDASTIRFAAAVATLNATKAAYEFAAKKP